MFVGRVRTDTQMEVTSFSVWYWPCVTSRAYAEGVPTVSLARGWPRRDRHEEGWLKRHATPPGHLTQRASVTPLFISNLRGSVEILGFPKPMQMPPLGSTPSLPEGTQAACVHAVSANTCPLGLTLTSLLRQPLSAGQLPSTSG